MKQPGKVLLAAIGAAVFAVAALPPASHGQAPAGDAVAIAQLVAEIADQQAKLAANQKLIDEKLAAIAENVRLAKIFVSRGGGTK